MYTDSCGKSSCSDRSGQLPNIHTKETNWHWFHNKSSSQPPILYSRNQVKNMPLHISHLHCIFISKDIRPFWRSRTSHDFLQWGKRSQLKVVISLTLASGCTLHLDMLLAAAGWEDIVVVATCWCCCTFGVCKLVRVDGQRWWHRLDMSCNRMACCRESAHVPGSALKPATYLCHQRSYEVFGPSKCRCGRIRVNLQRSVKRHDSRGLTLGAPFFGPHLW